MKKIIVCIFAFLSIIGYVLSFESVRLVYNISLTLAPEQSGKLVSFILYSNDYSKMNESSIMKDLLTRCEKQHVSIVKTSPIDEYHVKQYVYMAENIYQDAGLELSKKQLKTFHQNKNARITNDRDSKADFYFPYFPSDNKLYLYPYSQIDFVDGMYKLIGENAEKVLYEWRHALPGLSIDSESTQRIQIDRELRNAPAMGAFMQLAAMLLVIAIVCILMYFSQSEEKLSIKKMFGYSSFHLLIKENRKLFIEVLVIGILIFTTGYCVTVTEFNLFIVLLLKYLLIFLVIEAAMLFLIFLFLFYFFKNVQAVQILKHKQNFKTLLTLNMILRVVIVILGISIIGENVQPMLSNFNDVMSYRAFMKQAKGYYHADNLQRMEDDVSGFMKVLYKQVNESGGIGIEESGSQNWDTGTGTSYYNVNENYINSIGLKDVKGMPIHVKKGEYYLLASKTNKTQADTILENELSYGRNIAFKEIQPDQKIFTFNTLMNHGGVGVIEEPIIMISDYINPWFVYLTEKQIDEDAYEKALYNSGYKATIDIRSVNDTSKLLYDTRSRLLLEEVLLIGIAFLALWAVIAQYVLSFMNAYHKTIAIKKTMGYSLVKRYKSMLLIMGCFYLVIESYCFLWNRSLIEQITVLAMFGFEGLLSLWLIIRNERRITAVSLKE